ncbi:Sec23/Sec24 zinc finger-containing protein [Collinsella sp. BA40]|nr:Sec23/Sec24 zinc finger-containing protein [Collinsella sp. BA40]
MSDRFPDVDWWRDRYGALLNAQDGFDDNHYVWKCTGYGHKNSISSENIYDSHADFYAFKDN